MIFNLFKSKSNWQHKDSNVRIAAINDELSPAQPEDKTILLSLLNEDSNELVRRAILLKLNSFTYYLQAHATNNNSKVQRFATEQIHDILANKHIITLSFDEKQTLLTDILAGKKPKAEHSLDTSILYHWLDHENEPALVIPLFNILANNKNVPQFLLQVFTRNQSAEVQKALLLLELPVLSETAFLTKLSKKAVNDAIVDSITNRLAQLSAAQEKPKKVLKQKQLLLSKLLSLKEQADYSYYIKHKILLEEQWHLGLSDLDCLSEIEQQTLLAKFKKILGQLIQIFAPKEEAYQQAKIAKNLRDDKCAAQNNFSQKFTQLNQEITTAVFESEQTENELLNQTRFSATLNTLKESIMVSVLNTNEQTPFLKQVSQLEQQLTKLPDIAQSVSEATYLISSISQLALPKTIAELNDRQQTYDDWLTQYKAVNIKACGVLPQSITDAHQVIKQMWQQGLVPLQQAQKKLFNQTKKKLIDINCLLSNGKYKVCFGLFKGVNQDVTLLSRQQQQQLQRDFDGVSKKIAEIIDWEHYIATPRKQELLAEINGLVATPLADPNAQAEQVKRSRKTWNSLGHADEALDKTLNEAFNLACEQAFAPCRAFYDQQEKKRAQHLVIRYDILAKAQTLADNISAAQAENSNLDFKKLEGELNKLQQVWQQAGEVDRKQYHQLVLKFKSTLQPIKKAIKHFYDVNGVQKQALIEQAEQQLTNEDNNQAIDCVKKLQQQWRDIGFSGAYQESKLWKKFRAINDQVFAKRVHAKSEQQTKLAQLGQNFNQALDLIKSSIKLPVQQNEQSILVNAKNQAESLLKQVKQNKPVLKAVVSSVERFIAQLSKQIAQRISEQEQKCWTSLFTILEELSNRGEALTTADISAKADYQMLTNFWQKRILEYCALTTLANANERADKTLALEILAQVETPAEFAAQRMAVQVDLMQTQMQTSEPINLTQYLVDWLHLGKLAEQDKALLTRLKVIFI